MKNNGRGTSENKLKDYFLCVDPASKRAVRFYDKNRYEWITYSGNLSLDSGGYSRGRGYKIHLVYCNSIVVLKVIHGFTSMESDRGMTA